MNNQPTGGLHTPYHRRPPWERYERHVSLDFWDPYLGLPTWNTYRTNGLQKRPYGYGHNRCGTGWDLNRWNPVPSGDGDGAWPYMNYEEGLFDAPGWRLRGPWGRFDMNKRHIRWGLEARTCHNPGCELERRTNWWDGMQGDFEGRNGYRWHGACEHERAHFYPGPACDPEIVKQGWGGYYDPLNRAQSAVYGGQMRGTRGRLEQLLYGDKYSRRRAYYPGN